MPVSHMERGNSTQIRSTWGLYCLATSLLNHFTCQHNEYTAIGKTLLTWGILLRLIYYKLTWTFNYWFTYWGKKKKDHQPTIKQTLWETPFLLFTQAHLHSNISPPPFLVSTSLVFTVGYTQSAPVASMRWQAAQEAMDQCIMVSFGRSLHLTFPPHCSLLRTAPLLQHRSSTACSPLVCICPDTGCPWATVPQGCPCPSMGRSPSRVLSPAQSASFQESISSHVPNNVPFHRSPPLLSPFTPDMSLHISLSTSSCVPSHIFSCVSSHLCFCFSFYLSSHTSFCASRPMSPFHVLFCDSSCLLFCILTWVLPCLSLCVPFCVSSHVSFLWLLSLAAAALS